MRITDVTLYTDNLQAMVQFYVGKLAFPLVGQTGSSVSFRIGYSLLTFSLTTTAPPAYHFAFLVPKNQFMDAYRWVQNKMFVLPFTETTTIADFTNWNAQAFYFHDAAENILEIISHHDLPGLDDSHFSVQSIIGICEMGLVVPDVTAACEKLEKTYGVPRFAKGPYGKDFAVMGEEDGLLIISKEGRGWLPTGQLALPVEGRVLVETGTKKVDIPLIIS